MVSFSGSSEPLDLGRGGWSGSGDQYVRGKTRAEVLATVEVCGLAFFLLRAIRQRGDRGSLPIWGATLYDRRQLGKGQVIWQEN